MLRTLHSCASPTGYALHGVAVVSAIMGSSDPRAAASSLRQIFRDWAAAASHGPTAFLVTPGQNAQYTREGIAAAAAALVDTVRRLRPLVHQVFSSPYSCRCTRSLRAKPSAETESALDHEQRRQDTIRECHARAGWIAHHGRCRRGTS
jgi:hypothetical protein